MVRELRGIRKGLRRITREIRLLRGIRELDREEEESEVKERWKREGER